MPNKWKVALVDAPPSPFPFPFILISISQQEKNNVQFEHSEYRYFVDIHI